MDKLIAHADRLGNGAVFKRLGYLAERGGLGVPTLVDACSKRLTQGNAKLDAGLPCRRLVSRWRLFVPESWMRMTSTAPRRGGPSDRQPTKAKFDLDWEPTVDFDRLVRMMVDADLERLATGG